MRRLPDRLLVSVVLSGGICALVALLSTWVSYTDLENWTYDFLINHGRYAEPSPYVIFVDFDNQTFAKIQEYPIPRAIISQVIQQIALTKPAVIGLDILLSEAHDEQEDREMQEALTQAGNVILAAQASAGQLPGVLPMDQFCKPEDASSPSGYCAEGQPGALGYASVNMTIDDDGFIRKMQLLAYDEKSRKAAESFPVFLAQQYLAQVEPNCKNCTLQPLDAHHASFRGYRVPYADPVEKTVRLGHWSPTPVKRISAWDVLSGAVHASDFENKLVLIGQGSDAARNQHFTPVFRVAQRDGRRDVSRERPCMPPRSRRCWTGPPSGRYRPGCLVGELCGGHRSLVSGADPVPARRFHLELPFSSRYISSRPVSLHLYPHMVPLFDHHHCHCSRHAARTCVSIFQ